MNRIPEPDQTNRANLKYMAITVFVAFALIAISARASFLQIGGWAIVIAAAAFLYLPLPVLLKNKDFAKYGLVSENAPKRLVETAIVALVILAPFYSVFFVLHPPISRIVSLPPHSANFLVAQLFLIAAPEEFFFRGWVQTELDDLWKPRFKIIGANLGVSWVVTAALFAAAHIITSFSLSRALVFFPGLLFGWFRTRTNSVVYPAILHAIFNITFAMATQAINL